VSVLSVQGLSGVEAGIEGSVEQVAVKRMMLKRRAI